MISANPSSAGLSPSRRSPSTTARRLVFNGRRLFERVSPSLVSSSKQPLSLTSSSSSFSFSKVFQGKEGGSSLDLRRRSANDSEHSLLAGSRESNTVTLQFSQFALTTQVGSLFAVFILDAIPFSTMKTLIQAHMVSQRIPRSITVIFQFAFFISFGFLFANRMLLTSFYLSAILSVMVGFSSS